MKYQVYTLVLAAAFVGVIANSCKSDENGDGAGIHVELKSRQEVYLLGEPVLLEVVVTNTTDETVRMVEVHLAFVEPEIKVYTSGDGDGFDRWKLGVGGFGRITRRVHDLEPNKPMQYVLRVVHDWQHPARLAFPEPGQFWAKVRFPFREEGSASTVDLESNRVAFHVEHPRGDALKIWKQISDPDVLVFMQTGGAAKELVLDLATLLKSSDRSPYHEPLEWALRRYYAKSLARMTITEDEAQLIRDVAGIEMSPRPLAGDKRLDQVITYHFPEQTPLEDVIGQISRQSGIPLAVHPEFREWMMITARVTQPLRDFMNARAAANSRWVRKGEGYMLAPLDDSEKGAETVSDDEKAE